MHKWYGTFHALDDINLDIMRGERVVICGPSGSGKSTLIRCVNRLEAHQEGRIIVGGIELDGDEKKADLVRRDVGMVFQQFNLFPHLTILENCVLAPVWVKKMPKSEARRIAMHFLERVRIPEQADKYPGQLSGGQQQRVAIARSLGLRPKIMLFDEVTSALDPELVGEVLRVLRELAHATDMAMLLVTHEINFAADIADRVLMFDAGKIIEDGPPSQVIRDPAMARTKQFLRAVNDR